MARAPKITIAKALERRLGRLLALAMVIADLAGRAEVVDEVAGETGRRVRAKQTQSFRQAGKPVPRNPDANLYANRVLRRGRMRPAPGVQFVDDPAVVLGFEKLTPTEAVNFFRQKIGMTRAAFDRLERRYRDAAFTIAGVTSVRMVERIQDILAQTLEQGETFAEFERRVNEALRAEGLSPLKSHHLETVFRTNVNSALNLGREHQMLDKDVRDALPYWRYSAILDSRVRPNHAALHGFIARFDDPVWNVIAPPNGFNCRCTKTPISEASARRRLGDEIDVPGLERLPARPDEGFEQHPRDFFRSGVNSLAEGKPVNGLAVVWVAAQATSPKRTGLEGAA